jgi:hypothetical protein
MGENTGKAAFSSSQKTAASPLTLEGAVEEITSGFRSRMSTADAQERSQQILLAAADLILSANTGLLAPVSALAVSPNEVVKSITPLLAGESAQEHLDAVHALQHQVASLERRRRSARKAMRTPASFRRFDPCGNTSYTWLADRLRSRGQAA